MIKLNGGSATDFNGVSHVLKSNKHRIKEITSLLDMSLFVTDLLVIGHFKVSLHPMSGDLQSLIMKHPFLLCPGNGLFHKEQCK